ncbi:MAG: FtsX-like permease family protein [Clostridiales bacterium]|jgi:ABC-type lipoprotein release transport system permease subunit|nr:FtsX-like permease family protein [Clostridiales bacterium]
MFRFILKGSFSRPLGAVATVLIVALAVILLYSVFSFQEAVYDYYLGEPDTEAGSSDLVISKSGVGASLVPMGNLKSRADLDYAIGSISMYCMYEGRDGEEAIYLRTFEKSEIETLHDIKPVYPQSKNPSEILMDQIIISKAFADYQNLEVGDTVELSVLGESAPFYVEIIAENQGYFYNNPNVILGVSGYISYLMDWNLGKIYNRIYISVNDQYDIQNVMDSISEDPNFSHAEVKQSFDEEETHERVSTLTTLFDFAGVAIIILSLLMIYKLYQLMFYKKISDTIKLKVIGLSTRKIALLYAFESLILSTFGSLLGALVAVPSLNLMISSALPDASSSVSLAYIFISFFSGIILSLGISLLPIISSTRRSIRENMNYSKSPRKKYPILISIILVLVYVVLIILENSIPAIKGVMGLINTIFAPAVFMSVVPIISIIFGHLLRKSRFKTVSLSSIYIGKNENLNIAIQLFTISVMFAIFISNSLNVTTGYTEYYSVYSRDKLIITNSGSLSEEELLSIDNSSGITDVIPTLEIQGQAIFSNDTKSVFAVGIDGEDLSSFFNVTSSMNMAELEAKLSESDKYIVVSDSFRYTKNLSLGDTFVLEYKNVRKEYEIVGFVSTNYNIGKVVFINRGVLSNDFSLDNQNLIYLTSSSLSESASFISALFPDHNIQVIKLSSFVQPTIKSNEALNTFLRYFSIFIIFMVFAGVIINIIMSRVQRKTDETRLMLLGVSKKLSLLYSFLEGVLLGLPSTILAFLGGISMLSSSISATIFFGFYQPFVFQIPESILISCVFFLLLSIISPVFFLFNRPKNISSSLKIGV